MIRAIYALFLLCAVLPACDPVELPTPPTPEQRATLDAWRTENEAKCRQPSPSDRLVCLQAVWREQERLQRSRDKPGTVSETKPAHRAKRAHPLGAEPFTK